MCVPLLTLASFGNSGPLFRGICPNRRPNGEASRTTTKCTLPFVLSTIDASECVLDTLRDWLPKIVQFSATRAPCRWVPKVDICRCHDRSTANEWSQTWFSGLLLPIKHRRVLWDHSFSRQGRQHARNARSWATLDCLKNEFWAKSRYWSGCALLSSIVHYWRSFPNSSYSARYRQNKTNEFGEMLLRQLFTIKISWNVDQFVWTEITKG